MKLFTVGPVACYPEVLEEMSHQMFSHRSEEYKNLHRDTVERLQGFLDTSQQVFLFPSSGSGVMEGAVRNCVDDKMLCCINGAFGERFAEVGESNGKNVIRLKVELGEPIRPEVLDDALKSSPSVEAVSITYNETSVGVLNPLPELSKVVRDHGKLIFVDAVSAMGGVEIKVDQWGLDVCFASSQKCFGVPPGLAVASISEKALERSENAKDKGWYFDFKLFEKYQKKGSSTHMTPAIPQIFALNRALKNAEMNGKDNFFKLYRERSMKIRMGVEKLGLNLFPSKGFESPTVNCIKAPSSVSGIEIYRRMRDKGYELAQGYGKVKDRTFRIGNMGYILMSDIDEMMVKLGDVLESLIQ